MIDLVDLVLFGYGVYWLKESICLFGGWYHEEWHIQAMMQYSYIQDQSTTTRKKQKQKQKQLDDESNESRVMRPWIHAVNNSAHRFHPQLQSIVYTRHPDPKVVYIQLVHPLTKTQTQTQLVTLCVDLSISELWVNQQYLNQEIQWFYLTLIYVGLWVIYTTFMLPLNPIRN